MYLLKRGVALFMSAEIENIISVLIPVYRAFSLPIIITSGLDGPHRANSLHYKFRAIDVRIHFDVQEMNDRWKMHGHDIIGLIRDKAMKLHYPIDVVEETDHLHIEWDDKGKP